MNVSTYNELFVEKLYLNGVEFNVENFKGEPGAMPTVDSDATENKGADGTDWSLRYQTIDIPEQNEDGILTLPDPSEDGYEYTAIQVTKNTPTTGNITVMTHDDRFMGRLYAPHIQNLHLIKSPNNFRIK
jgi:hypothetical protein